ncbi:hypothetical protein [Streptomyces sp. NPDC008092]|uniref:hypothetical protein n=1 Tax=Streptomyces sp. NPDC008092 TaxID=3364808 RepID=UPI0036E8BB5F
MLTLAVQHTVDHTDLGRDAGRTAHPAGRPRQPRPDRRPPPAARRLVPPEVLLPVFDRTVDEGCLTRTGSFLSLTP